MLDAGSRGIREGYHAESERVSVPTPPVAVVVGDRWTPRDDLEVPGATGVSEAYEEVSTLIAMFGALAQKDAGEFARFGVRIEAQNSLDAQICEVAQ